MPYCIDYAGAMAYERRNHGRLFVASDEDVDAENYLNVYTFNNTWGLDGRWNDPDLVASIALPERIGPGVALAFQPSNNPGSLLSGFLYLIPGGGTSTLYRRAFNLVDWTPDALGPGDGDTLALDSLDFDWRTSSEWTSYDLQVSTSPSFDRPAVEVRLTRGEFRPARGRLTPGRSCFWRVRGLRGHIPSSWSDARRFTLTAGSRARRFRQFPTEGLLTSGDEPGFDWPSVTDAERYQLQVAAAPEFTQPVLDVMTPVSEFARAEPLETGTWFWRTRWQATSVEWSEWSATSSFETDYGWQTLPPKPGASIWEGGAMCHVIDRENPPVEALYVMVGNDEKEFRRFNLNPAVWAWEQRCTTSVIQSWGASLTSRQVWFYSSWLSALMGGEDTALWEYDIRNDRWSTDPDGMPLPRACRGGSCIVRDEVDYELTLVVARDYWPLPTNFYKRVVPLEEDGPAGRAHLAHGAMTARLARLAGAVRLSYGLNSPGRVEAVVFDAAGRRVRTLFSGE